MLLVHTLGSIFLRRLYDAQGGIGRMALTDTSAALWGVSGARGHGGGARLSHGAEKDLRWFAGFASEPRVGRALWRQAVGVLTTDESPYG